MNKNDYTVPALQKGLQILAMFNNKCRKLSQSEMADHLGVSSSSIYRIIQTLCGMGYLKKVSSSRYELGSQVVSRGFSYLASREIVEIAAPYITKLRDRTSLSSHLAVRDGVETLYVFRALALQRVSVNVPIGTRFPCHITAMGRALLFGMPTIELEQLYKGQRIDGYPAPSPQTLPDLIAMCQQEQKQGWCRHYSDDSSALAVPICDYTGETVAAMNISGPDLIMNKEGLQERLLKELKSVANEIMLEIGGSYKTDLVPTK